eukprot:CAMPEP_0195526018 /NCGR_PEP_ID=MMETSP0794_2-20130614/26816_1 /TAXON_ID=515487 /ORGANISM="Stephanopyxis turris, Strain CCMP 815" /LENGTH=452 /DNA_ID=CAMNT_0040656617 /DNA_START=428 /DNA_END=1786 /DNA_ORIENTATION=+
MACRETGGVTLKLQNLGLRTFPLQIVNEFSETLEVLNMGGNRLNELPPSFAEFEKLRIAFFLGNEFEVFPPVLGSMPTLKMVSFKSNRLSFIPANALSSSIVWLILTDNELEELPASVGELRGLRKCMLAGNRIRSLPKEMSRCTELELLRLSANRFTEFPPWLFELPKLAWLALGGNPGLPEPNEGLDGEGGQRMVPHVPWDRLEIGETLGEGASGVVSRVKYSLHPTSTATTATAHKLEGAVKMFKGEVTSDGLPANEIKAASAAGSHPNLISVLAIVDSGPSPGLILSLIPPGMVSLGGPPSMDTVTRDVFPKESSYSPIIALRFARGVSSIFMHLHGKSIALGDLYAHNMLVNQEDGMVMMGDFGAATVYGNLDELPLQPIEVLAFGHFVDDLLSIVLPSSGDEDERIVSALRRLHAECVVPIPKSRPTFQTIFETVDAIFMTVHKEK